MTKDTKHKTLKDLHMENENYIEKRVNALSTYNVYWCLSELRARSQLPTESVLKNDALCKLQLIGILKHKKYSPRNLDTLLENSAENSIPLSYIKWLYEDKRAALWLKMVLQSYNISSNKILTESDIEIFIHDIVFNRALLISNNKIIEIYDRLEIALKNKTLELLKEYYLYGKADEKYVKWLTKNSSDKSKIKKSYRYMSKIYDLDNLKKNKEENKRIKKLKESIKTEELKEPTDKTGYKQALVCTTTIAFKEADTAMQLCHILASLDYWMFNTYWLYQKSNTIDEEKADNRRLFIENMDAAWHTQENRDRNKSKKKQGIDLTDDSKKNLKYLAKAYGKTQNEVLNGLVESSYKEARYQEIRLNPSFTNSDDSFDKILLAQPVNFPSENNEEKPISEDSVPNESTEERNSTYAAESALSSTYNQDAFSNEIFQTQSFSLPSGHSEREIISEDISSIKGQEEPNSPHVGSFIDRS